MFKAVDMVKALAQLDRDQQAWAEWVNGSTMAEIGRRRGVTHGAISQAIARYLSTVPPPERDAYRARILARYEELYLAHREAALQRPRTAAIVRGILDSEARLLGLVQSQVQVDGEVQVQHRYQPGPTLDELIERMQAQGMAKAPAQVVATRLDQGQGGGQP